MGEKTEWKFTADATEMKKALADIINGLKNLKTEAASTSESLVDVTKQNKKTAVASKALASQTKELSGQMSRLGHLIHSIAAPRSALSTYSNKMMEAGAASRGLTTMVASLHPAILVGAAIVATMTGAWVLLTNKEKEATESAKEALATRGSLNKILLESKKRVMDLHISLMVANKEITAEEAAGARASIESSEIWSAKIEKVNKTLAKAKRELAEIQDRMIAGEERLTGLDGLTVVKGDVEKARELEGAISFLITRKRALSGAMHEEIDLTLEVIEATANAKKATDALTAANKPKKNTALKTTLATALQLERAFKNIAEGALSDIITEEGALTQEFLKTSDQLTILIEKTKARVEGIDAQVENAKKLNLTEEQLVELLDARKILETQLTEVGKTRFELNEQLIRQQEELAKTEWLENLHEGLTAAAGLATSFGDAFGASIDFIMGQNENLSKSQKKVLSGLFAAQKAAASGAIVINTAQAIMKALAELGPIAGAVSAIGIGIAGGVQLATVLAEPAPFHTGGIVPTNGMVNALGGEAFLNRETTSRLGQDGVNDLNSGGGGGGGAIQIQNVYGHRVFDRFVIDNISKGGPLSSAIQGGSRVGHSTRSTS